MFKPSFNSFLGIFLCMLISANAYAESPEAEALNNGAQLANRGKFEEAVLEFSKAIALKPDYAMAYFDRGLASIKLDELDRAISDFSMAIELKPKYAAAYNGRGIAYAQRKEYTEALADLLKAKSFGYKVNEGLLATVALNGQAVYPTDIETTIIGVDLNNSTLYLFNPLGDSRVKLLPNAVILKDGLSAALSSLREGNQVVIRLEGKDEEGDYLTRRVIFWAPKEKKK